MQSFLIPFAVALMAWFFATGAILWLDRRPEDTWGGSLLGTTVVSGFAFAAILISAESSSVAAAYAGFAATILLWGWHEMSFLMGCVTGPRRLPCPPGATGWRRFKLATATLIHHEIALAAMAAPPGSGVQVQLQLLLALSLLGVVEYAFLLLPVRDSALWSWAIPISGPRAPVAGAVADGAGRAGREKI